MVGGPKRTRNERFMSKVRVDESGCWLWVGSRSANGYGVFRWSPTRRTTAHRGACLLMVSDIPEGWEVDHLCRVHACVNPAHLEAVTVSTNNDRRLLVRGDAHHNGRKAECPQGHPLSGDNLYIHPSGSRVCRTCSRNRTREYMRRVNGSVKRYASRYQ